MIVKVTWEDAYFLQVIMPPEDAKKVEPYIVESVGWLLSKDKKDIRIAFSQINDGRVREILVIPMSLVHHVKRLR